MLKRLKVLRTTRVCDTVQFGITPTERQKLEIIKAEINFLAGLAIFLKELIKANMNNASDVQEVCRYGPKCCPDSTSIRYVSSVKQRSFFILTAISFWVGRKWSLRPINFKDRWILLSNVWRSYRGKWYLCKTEAKMKNSR